MPKPDHISDLERRQKALEGKKARTDLYKELQKQFDGLANVKNADEVDSQLETWEANNKDKLKRQRVGSFRGWKNVAIGQLKRKTDFVFIPAVRDASEDANEARSPVKQLVDTLAKQTARSCRRALVRRS